MRKRVSMTSFVTPGDTLGWTEARGSDPEHSDSHPWDSALFRINIIYILYVIELRLPRGGLVGSVLRSDQRQTARPPRE